MSKSSNDFLNVVCSSVPSLPHVSAVSYEHFSCTQGKAKRDQSLEDLRQHIHKYYIPLARQFMVLFPEGGFLHKRREVSQR